MNSLLVKVAFATAIAVPIGFLWAEDEKKPAKANSDETAVVAESDDDKPAKKRKVRTRVRTPDGDAPQVRVLLGDDADEPAEKQTYLGVGIEPVPAALAAHLPDLLGSDQGLLVGQVMPDSPAAKAGLKEFDVIVSYDDQKLLSPEQLTKLVRGDKTGREVTLGVIRAGKQQKVSVTLAERELPRGIRVFGGSDPEREIRALIEGDLPRGRIELRRLGDPDDDAPKARTDVQIRSNSGSMRLESLDDGRFKAEIEFKNDKGDELERTYEGTREEIRKAIESDDEVPEAMRKQLLRSLDFGSGRPGALRFMVPPGGDAWGSFPRFTWPATEEIERIVEQFSENLDPETREKLKGAFRSLEEPRKKPQAPDRSL